MILSGDTLFGTAGYTGPAGNGTAFSLNTDGIGFTNLHSFTGGSDGGLPSAGLILSGDTLYGIASAGSISHNGTVFSVKTDGTGLTTLHSFTTMRTNSVGVYTNSEGVGPYAQLILSGNTLYGTAERGGASGSGTVFSLKTDGSDFMVLHSFTGTSRNSFGAYINREGAGPNAGLILSGNALYGTATYGGSSGNGTVFAVSFTPQLTIIPSGPDVVLRWPTNYAGFDYTGFTLQSTANLALPVWTSNSPAPVVVNGQYTVTNLTTGHSSFSG